MKNYRFKTEAELIEEFGEDFRTKKDFGKHGRMDYLFGLPILYQDAKDILKNGKKHKDWYSDIQKNADWFVYDYMITYKPLPKPLTITQSDLIQILAELKFAAVQPRPADGVCKTINQIADRYNLSDEAIEDAVADMYRKHHPIRLTSAEEFFGLVNNITEDYKRNHGIK